MTTLAGLAGIAGSADRTGNGARFNDPTSAAVDNAGNSYVADYGNNVIRKITPASVVTTLGGLASTAGLADGKGSQARFNRPFGLAVDGLRNVYVGDMGNNLIRLGRPAGTLHFETENLVVQAGAWQFSVIVRTAREPPRTPVCIYALDAKR